MKGQFISQTRWGRRLTFEVIRRNPFQNLDLHDNQLVHQCARVLWDHGWVLLL